MKLRYQAKKRTRINYLFMGFETHEKGWWYNQSLKRWERDTEMGKYYYSTHQSCSSTKAFRRKLKKAPKGVKFILISRWKGHKIFGVGSFETNK